MARLVTGRVVAVTGAILLLYTSQSLFDKMFPFLLLFGVLVFAFSRKLGEELRKRMTVHPAPYRWRNLFWASTAAISAAASG